MVRFARALPASRNRSLATFVPFVVLLLATPIMSGCLFAGGSKTDITGRQVSRAEVASIQPGKTTEAQVLQMLGPSTTTTTMSDASVMHSWVATRKERKSGAMFLIFANASEKTETTTLSVTCKDGIVTNVNIS
jgi:outer membrane protein assembly factor BamE (lipoprotein component of BamABCDE complex)